jgi:hypothetical protein
VADSKQIPKLQITYFVCFFHKEYTLWIVLILYGHCQQMAVFELGKIPLYILKDVSDGNLMAFDGGTHHGVHAHCSESTIVKTRQGNDFNCTVFFIAYQDAPVHGHLYFVIANLQTYGWCMEALQKDQGQKIKIHQIPVSGIQHTVPDIVNLVGYRV